LNASENGPEGRFEWGGVQEGSQGFRLILEWTGDAESILPLPPKFPEDHLLGQAQLSGSSSFSKVQGKGVIFHCNTKKDPLNFRGMIAALEMEYRMDGELHTLTVEVPSLKDTRRNLYWSVAGVVVLILSAFSWWIFPRKKLSKENSPEVPTVKDLRSAFDRKQWSLFFDILQSLPEYPFQELDQSESGAIAQRFQFAGNVPSSREVDRITREFRRSEASSQKDREDEKLLKEIIEEES